MSLGGWAAVEARLDRELREWCDERGIPWVDVGPRRQTTLGLDIAPGGKSGQLARFAPDPDDVRAVTDRLIGFEAALPTGPDSSPVGPSRGPVGNGAAKPGPPVGPDANPAVSPPASVAGFAAPTSQASGPVSLASPAGDGATN